MSYFAREEVYAALDQERDYQDERWGTITENPHNLRDWLMIMDDHLNCAYNGDGDPLEHLRELTAVGVAALEQFGCPLRGEDS